MNGKPVRSVLARTPVEAWGKTLLSLGLIDEVMYAAALRSLQRAREDGFDGVSSAAGKKRSRESVGGGAGGDDKGQGADMGDGDGAKEPGREDPCPEELELRARLAEVKAELEGARGRSRAASLALASARIAAISPFAANPFACGDDPSSAEAAWLAAAMKKEKTKMGNTGNKKKIVNP